METKAFSPDQGRATIASPQPMAPPAFGRGAAQVPMLYAFSLGPIPMETGYGTVYIGTIDGLPLPPPKARNANEALAAFRSQVPPGTRLECEPALARAGARHGYAGKAPTAEVVATRAMLAFVLAHPGLPPRMSGELGPLMQAAAAFWKARPWERFPADTPIEVVVTGAVGGTYEAAIMGAMGEEFGLALYAKAGSIAKVAAAVDAGRMDLAAKLESISLTFDEGPRFAARAIKAFCGLPRVPQAFGMKQGRARPLDAADALALAVTLQAMSEMAGDPGEEGTQALGFGAEEVRVRVRVPPALFPVERPVRRTKRGAR